jgi:alkylation response protein AidB-like acyl-CoA dehydrogenase
MDLELAEEQRLMRDSVRKFAAAEVKPGARARDHEAKLAKELYPRLEELGLFELEQLDLLTASIALEEIARQDASLAFVAAMRSFHRDGWSERAEPGLGLRSAGTVRGDVSSRVLVAVAAIAVGVARGALEEATAYALDRKQFKKAIAEFQAIQWMLADVATEVDAARMLVHFAATDLTATGPSDSAAYKAKVYATEAAVRAAMKAIQIHGGTGYTREFPVERYLRDAKMLEICMGGSDRARGAIARSVLVG